MSPIRLRLRALREERGLSQQALGEIAGVRQGTISQIENDQKQRLDFGILERLSDALGVEPGELLERHGKRRASRRR